MTKTPATAGADFDPIPGTKALSNDWKWLHRTWWTVHYSVGLMGVAAGAIAAGGADSIGSIQVASWVPGVAAALATSLVTFLGPLHKAQSYHRAFHASEQAIFDFQTGLIDARGLSKRMEAAREVAMSGPGAHASRDNGGPMPLASPPPAA